MSDLKKSEIPFERVLFFSDAVVAIAITLLALDLKLNLPENQHLTFIDLLVPWKTYLAFILSFINIAIFWKTHHQMYTYIYKMNERGMNYNLVWLFFIVTLPFSTNVLSAHFGDSAAIFLYSLNLLALSICQNLIWYNADIKKDYINNKLLSNIERKRFGLLFKLDIGNTLTCLILSFFMPQIAFFFLFFKIPILFFMTIYIAKERRKIVNDEKVEKK